MRLVKTEANAQPEDGDEEVVDGQAEVGLEEEIGEAGAEVVSGDNGDRRVLVEEEDDGAEVVPEDRDGNGGGEEDEDGAVERQAEEVVAPRAKGEPGDDGVSGNSVTTQLVLH